MTIDLIEMKDLALDIVKNSDGAVPFIFTARIGKNIIYSRRYLGEHSVYISREKEIKNEGWSHHIYKYLYVQFINTYKICENYHDIHLPIKVFFQWAR